VGGIAQSTSCYAKVWLCIKPSLWSVHSANP